MRSLTKIKKRGLLLILVILNIINFEFFLKVFWKNHDIVRVFTQASQAHYISNWQDLVIAWPILIQYILLSFLTISIVSFYRNIRKYSKHGLISYSIIGPIFILAWSLSFGAIFVLITGSMNSLIFGLLSGLIIGSIHILVCVLFFGMIAEFRKNEYNISETLK